MKKNYGLLFLLLCCACAKSTLITGSWKSPSAASQKFSSILVASLTSNTVAKSTVESDFTALLSEHGVKTYSGIEMFPPDVSNSDSDKVAILKKVKGKNIDAILTITLLRTETESRYVDNSSPYNPGLRYGYYSNFWGYYNYWRPYYDDPGYYNQKIYYIETNIYDVKTGDLIWSAQSKNSDIGSLKAFSKQFTKITVDKLVKDGML